MRIYTQGGNIEIFTTERKKRGPCVLVVVYQVSKLINVHFKCMHYIVHKLRSNRVGWKEMGCAETYAKGRVWSKLIVYNYEHFLELGD